MKKIKGKLKIILITCGVLVLCTAALIGGIAVAKDTEEKRLVKTAYPQEDAQQQESTLLAENDSVSTAQADSDQPSENSSEMLEGSTDSNNEGGISIDDAKSAYQLMFKLFFKSEMAAHHINAAIDPDTGDWLLINKEANAYVDSQSGEVIAFYNLHGYIGETIFSEDEFASYKDNLTKDHDKYIEKATSFIEKNFADGRAVSEVVFDDVVFTGDPGEKGTFRLTLRVLMETGSSYCLVYTESPYNLERFFSYESQEACLIGSSFENGPPSSNNTPPVYTPEIVYDSEIGPEHLTVDEAMDLAIEQCELLTGETMNKALLSARFRIVTLDTSRAAWYIYNDTFILGLDAITGALTQFDHFKTDALQTYEPMPKRYMIEDDEDKYFAKAQEVLVKYLGNNGKVDYMMIDGIQVIFDDYSNSVSYLVDCHVIMETGPCYDISFAGSDLLLWRIYSYASEGAMFGF